MKAKSEIGDSLFDFLFLQDRAHLLYYRNHMYDSTGPLFKYWDARDGDLDNGGRCDDMALLLYEVVSSVPEDL